MNYFSQRFPELFKIQTSNACTLQSRELASAPTYFPTSSKRKHTAKKRRMNGKNLAHRAISTRKEEEEEEEEALEKTQAERASPPRRLHLTPKSSRNHFHPLTSSEIRLPRAKSRESESAEKSGARKKKKSERTRGSGETARDTS